MLLRESRDVEQQPLSAGGSGSSQMSPMPSSSSSAWLGLARSGQLSSSSAIRSPSLSATHSLGSASLQIQPVSSVQVASQPSSLSSLPSSHSSPASTTPSPHSASSE